MNTCAELAYVDARVSGELAADKTALADVHWRLLQDFARSRNAEAESVTSFVVTSVAADGSELHRVFGRVRHEHLR